MIKIDEASGGFMLMERTSVPWAYGAADPYERHRLATAVKFKPIT